jgi:lipopolysaccharide assembly protein A
MVWTMVGIGVVLLVAILVFILQNGQRVRVRFLMANGMVPLGVALLFAALLGALLVLVAGGARVLQLRVVARRHRRADQLP